MLSTLPVFGLVAIFLGSAVVVWIAGLYLTKATDVLAMRWNLGEALGGLVILAIVTNLPEIAIVGSGALRGELDVAVGNLLGGIAVQTVVLVLLDAMGKGVPLMARASSPALLIEGVMVVVILAVAMAGSQLPETMQWGRVFPPEGLIVALWGFGLFWVSRQRREPGPASAEIKAHGHKRRHHEQKSRQQRHSTTRYVIILLAGGLATLAGGVALEASGGILAERWGMSGVVFGATVLALATSLPEISTGWASIRLGDDRMAISDIFGGNAFLPVLFMEASLLSGHAVLPRAKASDLYLAALGILLTLVYITGLIVRPRRRVAGMGIDSLVVLGLYGVGVAGLLFI